MDIRDIERKSLVVAIWDKDSKSKDDFMAGVCVVMKMFKYQTKVIPLDQSWTPRCENL